MPLEKLFQYDRGKSTFGRPRNKAIVLHYMKRVLEQQGFDLNDSSDNKSVWSAEELKERLEQYGQTSELRVSEEAWREAYRRTLEQFGCHGEKLVPLADSNLIEAVRFEKSAGLPTLRKKGDVFELEVARMQRILEDKCAPPPCVAYHRVQHGDKGPKTRLVWGYPLSMTLLEARFARPLIDNFLKVRSPMAFGLRKHELWARMIPLTRREVLLAMDYSRFDASIHPNLILMAFSVLGTWFTAEQKKEYRWDKIVHYFIHTPILMSDGYVYRKHQGVPSGSYFTQLVDSIVNYFAVQYISARLHLGLEALVLGDDSLVAVEGSGRGWLSGGFVKGLYNFIVVAEELGLIVNFEKSRLYYGRSRESVHFLGHSWSRGYPHREERDIARRLVYPERYIRGLDVREIERLRLMSLLGDAVEAWPLVRVFTHPSRHAVCFSTSLKIREITALDIGWYRHLQASGVAVPLGNAAYSGLYI